MESEAILLDTLKNWNYLKGYIKRLEISLQESDYKITTSYSDTKCFSSGMNVSKVESYCFSQLETKNEIRDIKKRMELCRWAYRTTDMTEEERLTIYYTKTGKSLLQLSKHLNVAQAKIYRIRDRAVKKMFLKIQNGANNR